MPDEKILTVSIAAYNMEKYLRETIESLVHTNSIELLDVLIINDGSTDNTPDIALEYVERFPNSFRLINKENGGYGSTINCSLKHAKGKYYKLLDGDDWFQTENITPFLDYLRDAAVDMVLTPFQYYQHDVGHPKEINVLPYSFYEVQKIEHLKEIWMHTMAVRTELVKNTIAITEKCLYTDDEWFLKAALCCKTFVALPICIYCYRVGREGQSVSAKEWLKHSLEYRDMAKKAAIIYRNNACLAGLEEAVAKRLSIAYSLMFRSKRTNSNIKDLFEFRRFINEKAGFSLSYVNSRILLIHRMPFLLVIPYPFLHVFGRMYRGMKRFIKGILHH